MKKIITAVAAVAMAASAFAFEFSGALKTNTDLFNMKFAEGEKPTVLKTGVDSGGYYWGTRVQAGVSADKCGAQFALSWHGWDYGDPGLGNNHTPHDKDNRTPNLYLHDQKMWFSPVDMLKVTILNVGDHINNSYTDDKRVMHLDGAWQFTLTPVDGLTVQATLADKWIDAGTVGNTGLKVAYGADFGTIGAMMIANNNFKTLTFGAGYSGTFDALSLFADAAIYLKDGKIDSSLANNGAINGGLKIDMQAKVSVDPVTFTCFTLYENALDSSLDAKAANALLLRAKGEVKAGSANVYCEVKDDDFIAETFKMDVNPGVGFSIGAASCDFGVKFHIEKDNMNVSTPFTVAINF